VDAGCDDFLSKPVNLDALLERTAHYIGKRDIGQLAESENDTSVSATSESIFFQASPAADGLIHSTLPMDDADFRQIVADFIGRLDERLESIESAVKQSDFIALQQQAHWLKGAGGTVGLGVFTEPARQLEDAAKVSDNERAVEILKTIRSLQSRIACPGNEGFADQTVAMHPLSESVMADDDAPESGTETTETMDEPIHTTLPMDDRDFCEIVVEFIGRLDERLIEMQGLVHRQEFDDLADQAHWLKGAGGTVGFPQLMEPSQSLMLAAREKSAERSAEFMDQVLAVRRRMVIPRQSSVVTN
jgi:HPt (histidine-containing phosphotransfer) domain-containing protein